MFRLEVRTSTPAWFNLALPLLAIAATLVLCSGLIALAGVVKRSRAPAQLGVPYDRGARI